VLSDRELERTSTQIIHPQIAQFSLERFQLEVMPNRFMISTPVEPFIRILDDVLNIFEKSLPHTPIEKLGINFEVHFKFESAARRLALGRALAPIEPWGAFGKRFESKTEEAMSGLITLVMQESGLADREKGWRRVQVQPSDKLGGLASVRLDINDHLEIPNTKDEDGAAAAINILRSRFDQSLAESKSIVSDMMEFASKLR